MMLPMQGIHLYRPPGMAHGSNSDSAAVAWYIILDSTAYTLSSGRILCECDGFVFNRKNTFCSYRRNSPCVGLRDAVEANELIVHICLYRENAIAVRAIDRSACDATSRVHAHRQRKNLSYLRNGCCIYYLRPSGSAHL